MLDSGVRRGADMLIAFCLGAQFVFFGRATLYGAVAGGLPGVKKAFDIFRGEIDLVMARSVARASISSGPIFCGARTGRRTADPVCAAQWPAVCAAGLAAAGLSSALSISSKVRPLVSGPNAQKPMMPRMYQQAK
jgi:hypothetical protein